MSYHMNNYLRRTTSCQLVGATNPTYFVFSSSPFVLGFGTFFISAKVIIFIKN